MALSGGGAGAGGAIDRPGTGCRGTVARDLEFHGLNFSANYIAETSLNFRHLFTEVAAISEIS